MPSAHAQTAFPLIKYVGYDFHLAMQYMYFELAESEKTEVPIACFELDIKSMQLLKGGNFHTLFNETLGNI